MRLARQANTLGTYPIKRHQNKHCLSLQNSQAVNSFSSRLPFGCSGLCQLIPLKQKSIVRDNSGVGGCLKISMGDPLSWIRSYFIANKANSLGINEMHSEFEITVVYTISIFRQLWKM